MFIFYLKITSYLCWKTNKKFINWICKKFDIADENRLEHDFEKETRISLDAEKQIKKEEKAKNHDFELEL